MPTALRPSTTRLFRILQDAIGAEAAAHELRWMREAFPSTPDLDSMLDRRIRGEPLQYILGTQPFGPLYLLTRSPILIPRPETEDWTIRLSRQLSPSRDHPISVLDLCTGSGCIPLLLCHLWPPGSVHTTGVDVSEAAIQLAKDNAAHCNIALQPDDSTTARWGTIDHDAGPAQSMDRNTFRPLLANIRDPAFVITRALQTPFDVITSNPPYISRHDYDKLPPSVKNYEDPRALLGDTDYEGTGDPATIPQPQREVGAHTFEDGRGLSFYHTIAELLGNGESRLLKPSGIVALEVGEGQASDVARMLEVKARMQNIEIWKDPWEKERVVVGRNQT